MTTRVYDGDIAIVSPARQPPDGRARVRLDARAGHAGAGRRPRADQLHLRHPRAAHHRPRDGADAAAPRARLQQRTALSSSHRPARAGPRASPTTAGRPVTADPARRPHRRATPTTRAATSPRSPRPAAGPHFGYTPIDLTVAYTPPDRRPGSTATRLQLRRGPAADPRRPGPTGRLVDFGYDAAGGSSRLTYRRGSLSYGYDATTGQSDQHHRPGGVA